MCLSKGEGGVCSCWVEKALRMAGYCFFLPAGVITFRWYTLGELGYLKQHTQWEWPEQAVSRI